MPTSKNTSKKKSIKKNVSRKVISQKVSENCCNTKINFVILTVFCILIFFVFVFFC